MIKTFKSFVLAALMLLGIIAVSSCKKEGIDFFRGSYGYVTSGILTLKDTLDVLSDYQLVNERGIMRIEEHRGQAVMTLSSVGGEAAVFDAELEGDSIKLSPLKRMVSVSTGNANRTFPMTVSGEGYKAGDMMVLKMYYESDTLRFSNLADAMPYVIESCHVNCVANYQK